ncbi:alpha-glucosidase, partial [Streptomyces sp. SID11233]|nr:alpha-glucosidase [Streptomyces sp. SID11233]
DRDELHDIYRSWRRVADEYGGVFVGEVWMPDAERFARYLRPDELHTAFNFNFMSCPWDRDQLRDAIDSTLAEHAPVGAPATWVLCNHDVTRTVTRYGRAEDTGFAFERKRFGVPSDLALGTRRARAAALLSLALPGSVYVYQGEELGLPEADIPLDRVEDPMYFRSEGVDPGRDGCRVPLPWTADAPYSGFGSTTEPWLPQPEGWSAYAAD